MKCAAEKYFNLLRLNSAVLYRDFAEQVCQPGDVVITFNYDTLLESELRKANKSHIGNGYGFALGESVPPRSELLILKLHGSTGWIDILFDGAPAGSFGAVGPMVRSAHDR